MAKSPRIGLKTQWEKEKLLVTSNFSFSHSVFKRHIPQTRKNQGLFGKGLKLNRVELNCRRVQNSFKFDNNELGPVLLNLKLNSVD